MTNIRSTTFLKQLRNGADLKNTKLDKLPGLTDDQRNLLMRFDRNKDNQFSGGELKDLFQFADELDTKDSATNEKIDRWVAENVNSKKSIFSISYDDDGGEKVARALNGESSIGTLTPSQKSYMIDAAVKEWRQNGNFENMREAAENLNSPETKKLLARAYAGARAADERIYAQGGQILTTKETGEFNSEMLRLAIESDPAAVIESFSGIEGSLGKLATGMPSSYQNSLVEAVATGKADPTNDGVSKMITAIFLKSDAIKVVTNENYRKNISGSLAQIMVRREGLSDTAINTNIADLQQRYDGILASPGGVNLLLNDKVAPELRGWALAEIAANPTLDAEALKDGWDSKALSSAYADPIIKRYQGRGLKAQTLGGQALRNTIGQALGIKPDRLPDNNESDAKGKERLDAGMAHQYYSPNQRIDAIAEKIKELGGDKAKVSIMPVTVTSNEFGAATFNVFKVQGEDGKTAFIEDIDPSRTYKGFDDWHANSRLPPGKMTYISPEEGGPKTENTAQVVDTFKEWALDMGDKAALGAGIVAGAALVLGTGGAGAVAVAGVAGAYTTARAGGNLYDAHAHGVDITDFSNAEVRSNWMDAAAGTLSLGAMGVARLATLAKSSHIASAASKGAAGLQIAADTADVASATNQAYDLASNWNKMDNGQRAMGMLNMAFWGGMTAASAHAGGGNLTDAFSFSRLKNNIQFGSPYPVGRNPDLVPGEMRVAYDEGGNGRATNIRIEHGSDKPDSDMLKLHSRVARQMEASGNLLDRIGRQFSGDKGHEMGSGAWEAKYELTKISSEARSIAQRLADPNLSAAERAKQEFRLEELEAATQYQTGRLAQLDEGEGWVAMPSKGQIEAEKLYGKKVVDETPENHFWVLKNGTLYLQRKNANDGDRLYYDPGSKGYVEDYEKPKNARHGHGENKVKYKKNNKGEVTEVSGILREFYTNASRSSAEVTAQGNVGKPGRRASDDGGHAIGHRFVRDKGLKNMFPQDANLNRGAYKMLENEMADWIAEGCDVKVSIKPTGYNNGRPAEIDVKYEVIDPQSGKPVHRYGKTFENEAGQVFNRVASKDMAAMIAAVR